MKCENHKNNLSCDCDTIHEASVRKVQNEMIEESLFNHLADFFKVFADSTRIKILKALSIEELCVCDIAVVLDMTKSAVSHQLRFLKEANLVKARRDGKNIFYSLADSHVLTILLQGLEHIKEEGGVLWKKIRCLYL